MRSTQEENNAEWKRLSELIESQERTVHCALLRTEVARLIAVHPLSVLFTAGRVVRQVQFKEECTCRYENTCKQKKLLMVVAACFRYQEPK